MQSNLIADLGENLDLHIKINSVNDFNRVVLFAKYIKCSCNSKERTTRLNVFENILIAYNYKYKFKEKVYSHSL